MSAGGVEDAAHFGTLSSQFIVFSDGLFCLQDSDLDTFLLHKVQSGGGNLREETAAQKGSVLVLVTTAPLVLTFLTLLLIN